MCRISISPTDFLFFLNIHNAKVNVTYDTCKIKKGLLTVPKIQLSKISNISRYTTVHPLSPHFNQYLSTFNFKVFNNYACGVKSIKFSLFKIILTQDTTLQRSRINATDVWRNKPRCHWHLTSVLPFFFNLCTISINSYFYHHRG